MDRPSSLNSIQFICWQAMILKIYFHIQKYCCDIVFLDSLFSRSQDCTVRIVTRLWVTQSWVQFHTPAARNFSPLQCIKTSSWAHLDSYSVGTKRLEIGGKVARV